jgi:hypothetical protein
MKIESRTHHQAFSALKRGQTRDLKFQLRRQSANLLIVQVPKLIISRKESIPSLLHLQWVLQTSTKIPLIKQSKSSQHSRKRASKEREETLNWNLSLLENHLQMIYSHSWRKESAERRKSKEDRKEETSKNKPFPCLKTSISSINSTPEYMLPKLWRLNCIPLMERGNGICQTFPERLQKASQRRNATKQGTWSILGTRGS